jgi:hypothetical protein
MLNWSSSAKGIVIRDGSGLLIDQGFVGGSTLPSFCEDLEDLLLALDDFVAARNLPRMISSFT